MKDKRFLLIVIGILLLTTDTYASSGDFMLNIGKIYVVVAVIVLIFIGIVIYLIRLDNKVKKLENSIENEQ